MFRRYNVTIRSPNKIITNSFVVNKKSDIKALIRAEIVKGHYVFKVKNKGTTMYHISEYGPVMVIEVKRIKRG